jgi:hypothetical protein
MSLYALLNMTVIHMQEDWIKWGKIRFLKTWGKEVHEERVVGEKGACETISSNLLFSSFILYVQSTNYFLLLTFNVLSSKIYINFCRFLAY